MKIIITYVSAGTGHRRAAESLFNHFKENCKNVEIKITDALQKTNPIFRNLYIYGYQLIISHALWLWEFCFWFTSIRCLRKLIRIFVFITHRLNINNFPRLVIEEKPDFIISTHFLPLEVSTYLKRTKKINSKIITVITDFGVHPFWINEGTDLYVVASSFTKELLISEGIKQDNIRDFGIPIESKFLNKYDKNVLCDKLDIQRNKFTVLIVTGSFGIGPIEKIIKLLYKDVQILTVCANNKKLYTRLNNKNYQNVKVYGFVDNIQEFMSVSDIVITKPGGLSISEILVMELVPIFISPIPGQETGNVQILKKYGIGLNPRCVEEIKNIILTYKEYPSRLSNIKENIKAIKKPFAAKELCNAICQGSIGSTN